MIPGVPGFNPPAYGGQPVQLPRPAQPTVPQFIQPPRPQQVPPIFHQYAPIPPAQGLVPFRPPTHAEQVGQQLAHQVILRMLMHVHGRLPAPTVNGPFHY